jgi:hypothetical protein
LLPAGRASILALSEIGFAWLLGVTVLREPTNALAITGTLAVFGGCAFAATAKKDAKPPSLADATVPGARRRHAPLAAADERVVVDAADWAEGGVEVALQLSTSTTPGRTHVGGWTSSVSDGTSAEQSDGR